MPDMLIWLVMSGQRRAEHHHHIREAGHRIAMSADSSSGASRVKLPGTAVVAERSNAFDAKSLCEKVRES